LQDQLNQGELLDPFEIPDLKLSTKIDTTSTMAQGRSVVGRLAAGESSAPSAVMICATLDQIGDGQANQTEPSERNSEAGADAVTGVAGLLQVAEFLSAQHKDGKLALQQDLIFAVWPGHEQALHGSLHYAQGLTQAAGTDAEKLFVVQMDAQGAILGKDKPATVESLEPTFKYLSKNHPDYVVVVQTQGEPQPAYTEPLRQMAQKHGISNIRFTNEALSKTARPLNAVIHLDRIGRFDGKVLIQGTGSSPYWASAIESRNVVAGLPLATFPDLLFPSDASSFQAAAVPVISVFSCPRVNLNQPADNADPINAQGVASIGQLIGLIARSLALSDEQLAFVAPEPKIKRVARSGAGASLGTIPSYSADVIGVKISDVRPGTPAQKAGLKPNDIIVELAGSEIEDVQAYADLLAKLPIGKETEVVVEREGKRLKFKITPVARQR
jgi:biopolymer transport protein ExbD